MSHRIVAAGFLFVVVLAGAEPVEICVRDEARLGVSALEAFERDLLARFPGVRVRTTACEAAPIQLAVRWEAPPRYAGALGLAYTAAGQVLPRIDLYVQPVLRLLGDARAPAPVGRALARVAAHELHHYFSQRRDHDPAGVLAAAYRPADLR